MKDREWEVLDIKELETIQPFLASKEKTMEGVMNALSRIYEKPSASNKVFLMKCLFNMKMLKGGSITDHLK